MSGKEQCFPVAFEPTRRGAHSANTGPALQLLLPCMSRAPWPNHAEHLKIFPPLFRRNCGWHRNTYRLPPHHFCRTTHAARRWQSTDGMKAVRRTGWHTGAAIRRGNPPYAQSGPRRMDAWWRTTCRVSSRRPDLSEEPCRETTEKRRERHTEFREANVDPGVPTGRDCVVGCLGEQHTRKPVPHEGGGPHAQLS